MGSIYPSEFEVVRYEKLRHVHIFLVNILFRNMHEHSDFEVNVILDGTARVLFENREIRVQKNSLLLFNPYQPHEIIADAPKPVQILSVQISNRFCEEYFPQLRNISFSTTDLNAVLPMQVQEQLRSRIFSTARCFWQEGPMFQMESIGNVCYLMREIMTNLQYTVMGEQEYATRKRKTARVRRIIDYISCHYKEKIMLPELAKMEGVTTTYLSHFFRETLHMTFQEYLNRLRLEKALVLMKDSTMCLMDVCMECGFSDNKYLNRMFIKEFGFSASTYRKKRMELSLSPVADELPSSYSEYLYPDSECAAVLQRVLDHTKED